MTKGMLLLAAGLVLSLALGASALAAQETVIYAGDLKAAPLALTLGSWGSGSLQETAEVAFRGPNALKLTSQGTFQGGRIDFPTPLDISGYVGQPNAYLEVWLRPYFERPEPKPAQSEETQAQRQRVPGGAAEERGGALRLTFGASRGGGSGLMRRGGLSMSRTAGGPGRVSAPSTGRSGAAARTQMPVLRIGGSRGLRTPSGAGTTRPTYMRPGAGSPRLGTSRARTYRTGPYGAGTTYRPGAYGATPYPPAAYGRTPYRTGTYGARGTLTPYRTGAYGTGGTTPYRTGAYGARGAAPQRTQPKTEETKPKPAAQTSPAPPERAAFRTDGFRVHLVTERGTAVLAGYPIYPGEQDPSGWVRVGFPLSQFQGEMGTKLQRLALFGQRPDIVYIGQMKLLLDNSPLQASPAAHPGVTTVGQPVTFMAHPNAGLAPLDIVWDFDNADGIQEQARGASATHVYTEPGEYEATVTMRDATGANPETKTYVLLVRVKE